MGFRRLRLLASAALCLAAASVSLAQAPQVADPKGDDLTALKNKVAEQDRIIQQLIEANKKLADRLDRLEKGAGPAKPTEGPPIPEMVIPSETEAAQPATGVAAPSSGTPAAKATLNPDIAVIGNHIGRFISTKGDPDRNRFQLGEIEIALQQPVYPGITFHAQLAGDYSESFSIAAEEAYVDVATLFGTPLSATFGKKRLDFGKVNPIHPHARQYVDQPAPLDLLVNPDALSGNGATLKYLLPFKNVFAAAQIGFYKSDASADTAEVPTATGTAIYPAGFGVNSDLTAGRLWLSKALGKSGEFELGASHAFGRGDNGDDLSLTGADLTIRSFPGTFSRLQLQSEAFWNRRKDRSFTFDGAGHTRFGHYTLLSWRPDQFHEYGLRYDNSQYPWPLPGRDESLSLIWSNRLTESTIVRLQYKYGNRSGLLGLPSTNGYNEFYLQFIWGAGSHTHPLQ